MSRTAKWQSDEVEASSKIRNSLERSERGRKKKARASSLLGSNFPVVQFERVQERHCHSAGVPVCGCWWVRCIPATSALHSSSPCRERDRERTWLTLVCRWCTEHKKLGFSCPERERERESDSALLRVCVCVCVCCLFLCPSRERDSWTGADLDILNLLSILVSVTPSSSPFYSPLVLVEKSILHPHQDAILSFRHRGRSGYRRHPRFR